MVRAVVSERIELGDEMAQLAIAVHQIEHAHVERPGRQRGSRALGGAALEPHFESGEEGAPLLGHRARILQVLLVKLVDVFGIGTVYKIEWLGRHISPDLIPVEMISVPGGWDSRQVRAGFKQPKLMLAKNWS